MAQFERKNYNAFESMDRNTSAGNHVRVPHASIRRNLHAALKDNDLGRVRIAANAAPPMLIAEALYMHTGNRKDILELLLDVASNENNCLLTMRLPNFAPPSLSFVSRSDEEFNMFIKKAQMEARRMPQSLGRVLFRRMLNARFLRCDEFGFLLYRDDDDMDHFLGINMLHLAIMRKRPERVQRLLELGADPMIRTVDFDRQTAMQLAMSHRATECVKVLRRFEKREFAEPSQLQLRRLLLLEQIQAFRSRRLPHKVKQTEELLRHVESRLHRHGLSVAPPEEAKEERSLKRVVKRRRRVAKATESAEVTVTSKTTTPEKTTTEKPTTEKPTTTEETTTKTATKTTTTEKTTTEKTTKIDSDSSDDSDDEPLLKKRRVAEAKRLKSKRDEAKLNSEYQAEQVALLQKQLQDEKRREEERKLREQKRKQSEAERKQLEAKQREEEKRKLREEEKRKLREEAERKLREEEKRKLREEAERKLREEEERKQREAVEEERKRRETEETEQQLREKAEAERKRHEATEAERKRREAEEAEEAEQKRKQQVEADAAIQDLVALSESFELEKADEAKLEAKETKLEAKQAKLEAKQAKLEAKQTKRVSVHIGPLPQQEKQQEKQQRQETQQETPMQETQQETPSREELNRLNLKMINRLLQLRSLNVPKGVKFNKPQRVQLLLQDQQAWPSDLLLQVRNRAIAVPVKLPRFTRDWTDLAAARRPRSAKVKAQQAITKTGTSTPTSQSASASASDNDASD